MGPGCWPWRADHLSGTHLSLVPQDTGVQHGNAAGLLPPLQLSRVRTGIGSVIVRLVSTQTGGRATLPLARYHSTALVIRRSAFDGSLYPGISYNCVDHDWVPVQFCTIRKRPGQSGRSVAHWSPGYARLGGKGRRSSRFRRIIPSIQG